MTTKSFQEYLDPFLHNLFFIIIICFINLDIHHPHQYHLHKIHHHRNLQHHHHAGYCLFVCIIMQDIVCLQNIEEQSWSTSRLAQTYIILCVWWSLWSARTGSIFFIQSNNFWEINFLPKSRSFLGHFLPKPRSFFWSGKRLTRLSVASQTQWPANQASL